ncbi:MAG: 3-hydroxyacyl-CoA dehydrogenase [Hydrocarboniphaga sp.]|uniref:3-hydroxyacyl-CoA dehydrogenase NAD-binding domain-containing protein n=1 Tax=Hydrocarboniphaga sp. TaxID=2033016 RepID=UPI002633E096|nr:3-hydroxyacyl-CoA dehydrogenase NAD-binding domain-containing protein [Hydrocarboniphaga sp.]MDB5969910.1 3-hydroxyacyl-CoA dehydrogenase [Hydrocarboniphaga sp.]
MADLHCSIDADGVALLTLDVAGKSANVVTDSMRIALADAVERIAADPAIRGAVITSAKNDFMAGGDINAMIAFFDTLTDEQQVYREISRPFTEVLRRLETCGKPFAAAINGAAMGGGLELALACHWRVAADDPKVLMGLPEVGIGLMPGAGGSQRLPRLIGIQKAVPLMLQGRPQTAKQALDLGIIHAVVLPPDLLSAAKHWVLQGDAVQPWDRKDFKFPGGAAFQRAEIGGFFNLAATSAAGTTQRNQPAPVTLLSAVARGSVVPMDAALRIESRLFTQLLMNPVARNTMRTMFASKGACDKLARRPKNVAPLAIKSVGVIGAGLMGMGIAQVSAQAGATVVVIDASQAQAEAAKQRLADGFAKQIEKGRMKADQADAILAKIEAASDYARLGDCDIVVEAVFEDRKLKREVFARARAAMRLDAILASNTSSLPISSLAEGVAAPERFIGLHFFSPVDRMALVEVIRGHATSDATLAQALDYIKLLRKTPIIVNDSQGFFTTRVISVYLSEAMGMLTEGLAPALIDNAARQAGFPVGPLALIDDLTIELGYHASCQYRSDAGAAWVEPYGFRVQAKFCEELGRKGRRYGSGFYDYVDGRRVAWKGLSEVYPPQAGPPAVEAIKSRLLYIQALEAARAFEEGVISDPGEGDVGAVLGIGFPGYTGGPFSLIDTVGIAAFVAACEHLADRHGERYRPSAWLRARAARGEAFYRRAAAA